MVERLAWSAVDQLEPLPDAAVLMDERAVVAVGVVTGAAEEGVGGPCAAAPAGCGVLASCAESPQVTGSCRRPGPHIEVQFRSAPDDVGQGPLADIAARVRHGRKRRAALDRPVGLDPQGGYPRLTALPPSRLLRAVQQLLVRTVIAD